MYVESELNTEEQLEKKRAANRAAYAADGGKRQREADQRCADKISERGELCVDCGINPRYRTYRTCQQCYYVRNREKYNASSRRYNQRLRDECFAGYGNKCACCGESNMGFLTLDHVNRDGSEQRRSLGYHSNLQTYRLAIELGFPDEYQLLCFNCNCGRERFDGVCPHKLSD